MIFLTIGDKKKTMVIAGIIIATTIVIGGTPFKEPYLGIVLVRPNNRIKKLKKTTKYLPHFLWFHKP